MRIKWTSIPKVINGNPVAPWVGPGVTERMKKEAAKQGESHKRDKNKTERALDWLRGSR
jgi:hypothetical protein